MARERHLAWGWIVVAILAAGATAGWLLDRRTGRVEPAGRVESAAIRVERVPLADLAAPPRVAASGTAGPEAPALPSSGSDTTTVRVRVTADAGSRTVPGASVTLVDASGARISTATTGSDAMATLSFTADRAAEAWIVVRHPDYADAIRRCPTATADLIVDVTPGAAISGRVRISDGSVPTVRLRVIARAFMSTFSGRLEPASSGIDDRVVSTNTDADGRFRLTGLAPTRSYDLDCAGEGLAAETVRRQQPGAENVEIFVQPVYGVAIRFVDELGVAVSFSPGLSAEGAVAESWSFSGVASPFAPRSPAGRLLGLGRLTGESGGSTRAVFAFGDGRRERLGPVPYRVQLPGFEAATFQAWLEPIGSSVTVMSVPLHRLVPGSAASIRVRLTGVAADLTAGQDELLGYLRFEGSSVGTFNYAVRGAPNRVFVVDGVPPGNYRVAFVAAYAQESTTGASNVTSLSVAPDLVTSIDVGVGGDTSALIVSLAHDDLVHASPFPWEIELKRSGDANSRPIVTQFDGWSGTMLGLSPGDYQAVVKIDDAVETREIYRGSVSVARAKVVTLGVDSRK